MTELPAQTYTIQFGPTLLDEFAMNVMPSIMERVFDSGRKIYEEDSVKRAVELSYTAARHALVERLK